MLEYKFFEPAFYHTDVPDWGTALSHCLALGDKAMVVLDTGHHAPGTNIEFIVAPLLRVGRLGAFDFNSRFYADDDLMVGAADPFQLFRIMHECVRGGALDPGSGVQFMLDQCHNIEPKIPGQIRCVMNVQEATAKALLVDQEALRRAQPDGDVLGANARPHGRLRHRRPAAAHGAARRRWGWSRIRAWPTPDPATPSASRPSASAATGRMGRMTSRPAESPVEALLGRSNRLGADPRTTNYAGGNTSAKGTAIDPVTGAPTELLWVKGSGGDLGTLTEAGLSVLRLDRLRALVDVYPGIDREDEMVAAFDYCLYGRGGAAPSIDTAMHGLVDAAHVDHLHPDSGIAFATAADGEALTTRLLRRPRGVGPVAAAGLPARARHRGHPPGAPGRHRRGARRARHHRLGRHIRGVRGELARDHPHGRALHRRARPVRAVRRRHPGLRAIAGSGAPRRGRPPSFPSCAVSRPPTGPMVGHYTDDDAVLDFLTREAHPRLAALGTSLPGPLPADEGPADGARPAAGAPLDDTVARLRELHAEYRADYRAYYERHADARLARDARRRPGHRPRPGRGMFTLRREQADRAGRRRVLRQRDQRDAWRRGALHATRPIPESEKFRIEYWALEEAKLQRMPKPKPLATRVAFVTGGGSGIGKAIARRLAAEGACVVVADIDEDAARAVAAEIGGPDVAIGVRADVTDEAQVSAAIQATILAFGGIDLVVNNAGLSISKPLLETTVADWDLQHDVMARGSFLVSREAARAMVAQGIGGDIVYIASKNALFAGPNNVAYGATKADQAHQVRLLAAELGQYGIRVNGVNPDGVVRGSGIFAKGWGADRARIYGVPEEQLGEYYAQRTLLKSEVLPEHVAAAVFALIGGDLSQTTGLHIPVDSGVAAAFLR